MSFSKKTSLLIPSQLPAFIREDPNYSTFVLFLQAYYEWMEQQGGAVYESKKIPDYYDIDSTLDSFLDYFKTQFLNLFPQGSLVDERKLLKHSREIFGTKGTPTSFRFLFKVLYGSDVEVFNTKDFVFRASDGKWIVTKSIQVNNINDAWKGTRGYKVFGETSLAYAVIEKIEQNGQFTTLILSDVFRTFVSGENVRVVDDTNSTVLINGSSVTGRIIGLVNSVNIDPSFRGQNYKIGDPVVFYGGLDSNVANPIGANAAVSSITSSSFTNLLKQFAGTGYSLNNTEISVTSTLMGSGGAVAALSSVDANTYFVNWLSSDTVQDASYPNRENITLNSTFEFPNVGITNANVALSEVLSFSNITTFGVNSFVIVVPGTGYTPETTIIDTIGQYVVADNVKTNFASSGMLSPILISEGGINYNIGETIIFTGGSGFGAFANVTNVDGLGGITSIEYVPDPAGELILPLGGMGYRLDGLPQLSVNTVAGANAVLYIPGLVGDDATVIPSLTPSGQIISIEFSEKGRNYVQKPGVSFRVLDLLAYNNNPINSVQPGDRLIQTTTDTPSGNINFFANVDSLSVYTSNSDPFYTTYSIRLFNYSSDIINTSANLIVVRDGELIGSNLRVNTANSGLYTSGKLIYGNGLARGTVNLSQGLQYGNGIFLNSDGQPSGSSILQDKDYNEFTYFLKVNQALKEYKDTALSFLHPSGIRYKTFNKLDDKVSFNLGSSSQTIPFSKLSSLLGVFTYSANIANTNYSNTIIFTGLSGVNIANVVLANSFLTFYTTYGEPFTSRVVGSEGNNTIILEDNWITSVPNVAFGFSVGNTNSINIIETTNAWSIATGNIYTYLSDFVNINDDITFNGNTSNVTQITQQSRFPTINLHNIVLANSNGYITLTRNVVTNNVWVAGNVSIAELVQIQTEAGDTLTTELSDILILG